MVAVPRAIAGAFLGMNAGQAGEFGGEITAVAVADPGLCFKAIELGIQDRALEFAEAVISGDGVMLVPDTVRDSAAVLNRAA